MFYLQAVRKIKLEIKEECLYLMMELCVYGIEKFGCSFIFTHEVQRFVLHLCLLLTGHILSSKLKPLHYHVPCGDSLLEISLHHFMLHEIFVLLGTF